MRQEYQNDCPYYLSDFLMYVRTIKNHTVKTEEAYYADLRTFLRYLKTIHNDVPADTDFCEITIKDVPIEYLRSFTITDAYAYMNYLCDVRKNSAAARSRKTSSLRRFYDYLHTRSMLIDTNPLEKLEHPKPQKTLPKFLNIEQSIALLENIDSKNQIRDYCILTLFLNCGMRLSELAGLNLSDYAKSKTGATLRLFGKGQKERIIYLNASCVKALDDYISVRPKSNIEKNAIFLSTHDGYVRLKPRRIQRIVEDQLKRAGLGNLGLSVHKLRHTCATLLYEHGGVDVMVLKDILGHVNLSTTEIYTHLSDKDRREAAESSPLAHMVNTAAADMSDDDVIKDE